MILFILCILVVAVYTIFKKGWFVDGVKDMIKDKELTLKNLASEIGCWLFINVLTDMLAFCITVALSILVTIFAPMQKSQYSFEINSLKDNIVTAGKINSGIYSARGYFNRELSYFFSRPTDKGEIVGHISAGKTYIQYDNEKPRIEVHQKSPNISETMSKIFFTKWFVTKETEYYVLYVPEGTISTVDEYQINLE